MNRRALAALLIGAPLLIAVMACKPGPVHKSHPHPVTSAPASPHRTPSGWVPAKQPTPTCIGSTQKPPATHRPPVRTSQAPPSVASPALPTKPVPATRRPHSPSPVPSSGIGPPLAQTGPLVGEQAVAGCGLTAVGLLLAYLGMRRKNDRHEREH